MRRPDQPEPLSPYDSAVRRFQGDTYLCASDIRPRLSRRELHAFAGTVRGVLLGLLLWLAVMALVTLAAGQIADFP